MFVLSGSKYFTLGSARLIGHSICQVVSASGEFSVSGTGHNTILINL